MHSKILKPHKFIKRRISSRLQLSPHYIRIRIDLHRGIEFNPGERTSRVIELNSRLVYSDPYLQTDLMTLYTSVACQERERDEVISSRLLFVIAAPRFLRFQYFLFDRRYMILLTM